MIFDRKLSRMEHQKGNRIIVLVDMDCFYVQVEQKLQPEYQNKPCAVVQYNAYKGGGIIAVNYEARAKGVSRNKRGEDAQKVCPDIHLFRVPEVRGKADLTRYREAGASVMEVLCKFSECVERASIDEAYIDLTEVIKQRMRNNAQVAVDQISNTFVIGWEDKENQEGSLQNWLETIYEEDHLYNDKMLATAAVLVEEIRAAVYSETGYRCSAGIAHNKVLAKLTCGLHKPNKQTVLPEASIPLLYKDIPINKVRGLGGKFGEEVIERFQVKTMDGLSQLLKQQFINAFGEKSGSWLYFLSRGIENEPVVARQLPKSIGCGKNFPGKSSLNTKEKVAHWVKQLAIELEERLLKDQENNCRVAKLLTISVRNQVTPGYSTVSRSCPIHIYNADKIAHDAFNALQKFNTSPASNSWSPAILSLAIAAGKFEDRINHATSDIQTYFKSPKKKSTCNNFVHNNSDIDMVIGLLDTEPGLSNSTNMNSMNTKNFETETSETAHVSSDISTSFSAQVPSTSITLNENKMEDTMQNLSTANEILDKHSETKQDNVSSSSNNDANVSVNSNNEFVVAHKPKVKGFFARKLEERLRLEYEAATNALTANTSADASLQKSTVLTENLESTPSQKTLNDNTKTTDNQNLNKISSEIEKPKAKGFFATKREERLKAEFTPNSNTEIPNLSFNNIDTPSTSRVEETGPLASSSSSIMNSLLHQQKDDYSNLDPELTSVCPKCNRRIPIWEEEEHSDFHMALNLSKEFRSEKSFTKSTTVNPTTVKQPKTAKKRGRSSKSIPICKKPTQQNTIDSFFR